MIILLMLVPLSLMLLAFAIGAFVWAVRKGQFDDMDTPALDILRDDSRPDSPPAGRDVPGKDVVPDGD
ncbi:cbb3-type cytochrome oxidase assembly protein CcoS [Dyella kyungheensis]|uniref:cbb3-type cytochrome oxidase assembly protein CcoS n=1 Tax=Dyella kyungheensis TaxID=1242174 RepID=UPI003CF73C24